MKYNVLYRGPLESCNYDCAYCPFAKRAESYAQLENDRSALTRFTTWIDRQSHCRWGVLFTPWGEALVRGWYQVAIAELTHMRHVERVAIQTNLSCGAHWLKHCQIDRLALWSTFHPTEVALDKFVNRAMAYFTAGVRISVGVVGLREHFPEIERLREELPSEIYLWVNAYKREPNYYSDRDTHFLTAIDPLFEHNNQRHLSHNQPCFAGETSFTVDGEGLIRRCHFVAQALTSIHAPNWESALHARTCPNATCGCYIGYVHLKRLNLYPIYGDGILERIPVRRSESPSMLEERRLS